MTNNPLFWRANHAVLALLYLVAAVRTATGHANPYLQLLVAVILVAHVLEIPLALKKLADQQPSKPKVALMTFFFGFTWWLPASRKLLPVR